MTLDPLATICLRIYDHPARRDGRGNPMREADSLRMSVDARLGLKESGAVKDDGHWLTLTAIGRQLAAAARAEKPSRKARVTGYRTDAERHRESRAKSIAKAAGKARGKGKD